MNELQSISTFFILYAGILFMMGILAICFETYSKTSFKLTPAKTKPLNFAILIWGLFMTVFISQHLASYLTQYIPEDSTWALVASGFISQIASLLYLLITLKKLPHYHGTPINAPQAYSNFSAIFHGVIAFFAAIPLVWFTSFVWNNLLSIINSFGFELQLQHQSIVQLFAKTDSSIFLLTTFLFATIIAPITEELLFRATLYRFFKSILHPKVSISLSALLFALVHFNLPTFLPLFIMGLLLARSFERSGNILTPITFHALFNLNTLLILLIEPSLEFIK